LTFNDIGCGFGRRFPARTLKVVAGREASEIDAVAAARRGPASGLVDAKSLEAFIVIRVTTIIHTQEAAR
jgi:hypothetical protein